MSKPPDVRRDVLPIPDQRRSGLTTYDAKDPETSYPPITEVRPPDGAPNVLVLLIDDVGFGASSAFGGACNTPNAERLAAGGLKFTRFHTTALCSPTRAAMLSGRNHHSVGMGGITEIATSAPGYNSLRPEHDGAAGRDAQAQRLQHRAVRQVPRGARCGRPARWARSTTGPTPAAVSSTSTASSAARPTSGIRRSTSSTSRSSRRRRRRRATTSPRT